MTAIHYRIFICFRSNPIFQHLFMDPKMTIAIEIAFALFLVAVLFGVDSIETCFDIKILVNWFLDLLFLQIHLSQSIISNFYINSSIPHLFNRSIILYKHISKNHSPTHLFPPLFNFSIKQSILIIIHILLYHIISSNSSNQNKYLHSIQQTS